MTVLADRLKNIAFSQTMAVIQRIEQLKAEGRNVVSLASGELGLPIPESIRQAAAAAAIRGEERSPPTAGIRKLREAIADAFRRNNGLRFSPDQITVGGGSKQVIFNALAATVNPGDEVIFPAPYWVSYPDIAFLVGGVPVPVSGRKEDGYKLTPESLERAITARTRWLILNSPCNPTGVVYSAAELAALADVLRRHPRILVLSDDIYEGFVYAPATFATLATIAEDLAERIVTVNGFSKRFSMIGWRLGYAGGPSWLIDAMNKVQSQVTSGTATITQAGALAALSLPAEEQKQFGAILEARRDIVLPLADALPSVTYPRPDGAYYVFADVSAWLGAKTPAGDTITSDVELAAHILDAAGVVVLPGVYFGQAGALRLSYSADIAEVSEAFVRLRGVLNGLSPA